MDIDETIDTSPSGDVAGIIENAVVNDRYRIVKKLGSGGMGDVFLAVDLKLERKVALKTIRLSTLFSPDKIAERKARFEREAKTAAKINHPNLTTVHDVGEYQGTSYLVMEYVDGITLEELLEKNGKLSLEEAISIFNGLCDGMAEAHSKSIVHRDLKPANIMIDKKGQVKITDFGLAKPEMDTHLTQDGVCVGTPYYLSPEQARGLTADSQSDIWSMGLIFYEMLTGGHLFEGRSVTVIFHEILSFKPTPDSFKLTEEVSFLQGFFGKLVTPDRKVRAKDMGEVKTLLKQSLEAQGREEIADATTVVTLQESFEKARSSGAAGHAKWIRWPVFFGLVAIGMLVAAYFMVKPLLFKPDPLDPLTWGISSEDRLLFDRINSGIASFCESQTRGKHYLNHDRTIAKFNVLVQEGASHPQIDYYLGRAYFSKHDYEQALAHFSKGQGAVFDIWRIESLLRSNKIDASEKELDELEKKAVAKEYTRDIENIRESIDRLKKGTVPFSSWLKVMHLEDEGIRSGELRINTLLDIAAESPSVDIELELAQSLSRDDDPERAFVHIQKALDLDSNNKTAMEMLYKYYYLKKDYTSSIEVLDDIINRHEADKTLAFDKARLYSLMGQKTKALDWLETAFALGLTDFDCLRKDPALESIRGEEQFDRLLDRYER